MEGKVEVRRENGREGMNEGKWEGVRGKKKELVLVVLPVQVCTIQVLEFFRN